MATAIERLVATATAEIGYLEKASNDQLDDKTANAGRNNWTKYARDLDLLGFYNGKKNGYAWCDVFVDWCMVMTFGVNTGLELLCQPMRSYGAGCTNSAKYYKERNQFYTINPKVGDQIFFSKDKGRTFYHTGIVVKIANGRVYTIEGNTSSDAGVVENGGSVNQKSYALGFVKIGGYGRPNYEIIPDIPDPTEGDEDDMAKMTDEEFMQHWVKMRKELQDNDSSNYSAEAREWATRIGLIAGNGKLEDGTPNYMWQDVMSREQFITVLYRFAREKGLL